MIKRYATLTLFSAVLINLYSCKSGSSAKKLEGGLEYTIVKDSAGTNTAKTGDLVEMHIKLKADDSLLADSRKENNGNPVQLMCQESQIKGDWTHALKFLSPGDSAVISMSVDSLRAAMKKNGGVLPPFFEKRKKIIYEVKVVSIKSEQEMRKEQETKAATQKTIDEKILQDYFTQNKLAPTKTASGLYYTIEKEGTGNTPKPGQEVTVNYTGRTLDGKVFDSNLDTNFHHKQPFPFTIGMGQVITGWDEGVALMKKGGKAKMFIPSTLAYGQNSPSPAIAPNSILVFDVEVLKIEDAKAPAQQMPPVH
jgi:FKBP-type peptidyl-prolyl cis-trans isomerase